MEQLEEVVALHQHIGKFQKAQAVIGRHAGLVAFGGEHLVYREQGADVAHELNEVEIAQPVAVIGNDGLAVRKV